MSKLSDSQNKFARIVGEHGHKLGPWRPITSGSLKGWLKTSCTNKDCKLSATVAPDDGALGTDKAAERQCPAK